MMWVIGNWWKINDDEVKGRSVSRETWVKEEGSEWGHSGRAGKMVG